MNTILLIEDDASMQALVREVLEDAETRVLAASTASSAISVLKAEPVHLVLLDIGLPDADGLQFLQELRSTTRLGSASVILLTGSDDVSNKLAAFTLGADDYITKPFNRLEFRARVQARLKKRQVAASDTLTAGTISLDVLSQRAFRVESGGKCLIELTSLEFRLLLCLMRLKGEIVSREKILKSVWGEGVHVVDRAVDTHVYSLRRKLGADSKQIESIQNEGYRFFAN